MARVVVCGLIGFAAIRSSGQAMPATTGETLSGKRIVLAEALRGHAAVVIAGFSKEAGDGSGAWAKEVRGDAALTGFQVYQVAELEGAPGFVRGMIKSSMRKGVAAAEQDNFVVLTQDDKLWRVYFGVATDKDPYVVMLDASGNVLWHGHGAAKDLEPLLRTAKTGKRE
jgi:hypothetical protein